MLTERERLERKRLSRRNSKARARGEDVPMKRRGRPPGTPRCPVCKCDIMGCKCYEGE